MVKGVTEIFKLYFVRLALGKGLNTYFLNFILCILNAIIKFNLYADDTMLFKIQL